jgi:adenylate cyclase
VIKTIGDEIMCQFPSSTHALQAAKHMHELINSDSHSLFGHPISIRIGAHIGSVIQADGDIFGDTVNVCARIAALAPPGKTMISEETYLDLPKNLQHSCRFMMESYVKGKQQALRLYDSIWEQNDQLTRITASPRNRNSEVVLIAEYQGASLRLDQGAIRIGRGQECDLIVDAPQASRCHCEIRHTGNKCILTDASTNGTYVRQNDVELFFHNETVPLHQSGVISLGQSCGTDSDYLITFSIVKE